MMKMTQISQNFIRFQKFKISKNGAQVGETLIFPMMRVINETLFGQAQTANLHFLRIFKGVHKIQLQGDFLRQS